MITEKYDVVGENPLRFRLKNCGWAGIIISFTRIEAKDTADLSKEELEANGVPLEFDFHIWSDSTDFDIREYSTVHQMNEFQRLLGQILKHELEKMLD